MGKTVTVGRDVIVELPPEDGISVMVETFENNEVIEGLDVSVKPNEGNLVGKRVVAGETVVVGLYVGPNEKVEFPVTTSPQSTKIVKSDIFLLDTMAK